MSLARYEIQDELFTVGPSTFYRVQNRVLGNTVLLRRLAIDPSRADDVRDTFYREQRHAAGIASVHVQQPLDVFEESGYLWSVHDWRQARPTVDVVREDGVFTLAEASRVGAQVAEGLAALHARHFVHGKVTPRNVMIDPRGDCQLINLVKSADLAAGRWPLRPAVLGLSPFTPPEEFHGERPTFLSDLYGLAATYVFWLSGRWPRGGETEEEALQRAADGAALVNLDALRPDILPTLRDALLGALEVDPEARRGSVEALGSLWVELHQRHAAEIPSGFTNGSLLDPAGDTTGVRILGRHGAGAFGVVLRATDTTTGTVHAVKALKPEHRDDDEARERFLREARALQRIRHENVIRILGVGEEQATPYVVMEFVEGPDLATLLVREGTLDPERAAWIGLGMARGLAAIHEQSIVHRDLKPHNVLMAPGDRAIIADFGIARSTTGTRMTQTGHLVGTPAYMAPEQFQGKPSTPAVDLFALGTILYEMLAARSPFPAPDTLALIRRMQERPAEPLPDHVPPRLAVVVQRLLRKDPADRYRLAADVAVELEAIAIQ